MLNKEIKVSTTQRALLKISYTSEYHKCPHDGSTKYFFWCLQKNVSQYNKEFTKVPNSVIVGFTPAKLILQIQHLVAQEKGPSKGPLGWDNSVECRVVVNEQHSHV